MKYPTLIYSSDDTYGAIFPGHGWSKMYCGQMLNEVDPAMVPEDLNNILIEERFYQYIPRIKWCHNRFGATNCDWIGEWHYHWEDVKRNDNVYTHFTIAYGEDI